ncbi:MAG: nuclear transport factor 2 family protein [Actinomycetota bacterium]|nr:nuclear transport factor 2 family protein [Actinomycetota bacterium]
MGLQVEDRLAITELLSKYGLLIDRHRIDEWSLLFTDDAVFDVPGIGPLCTAEARRRMVETAPKGLHLAAPPIIDEGPDGSASCQQEYLFRNVETGRFLTGWYEDEVVKRDGQWLFARRAIKYFRRAGPEGQAADSRAPGA